MKNYSVKAEEFYKRKDFVNAVKWYSKSIEFEPKNVDLFYNRAMSHYHLGDFVKCLSDMNEAQKLQPNNPYRYSSRAYVKNKIGDVDGAISDYEKAIHLDPDDAIAMNNLGLVQEHKGYTEKARQNFEKADKLAGVNPKYSSPQQAVEEHIDSTLEKETNASILKNALLKMKDKRYRNQFLEFVTNGFKLKSDS